MKAWGRFQFAGCLICAFCAVALSPAWASQTIYRCVVNGNVTFKDEPCDGRPQTTPDRTVPPGIGGAAQTSRPARAIDIDYSTPYGTWRGQAQYQASVKGQPVREAHAVVPLVIEVEQQGRVRGASPDNGCKLLGVAAPYVAPNMLKLDVTLTECRYSSLNQRYSGLLTVSAAQNSTQLSLRSIHNMVSTLLQGPASFDIKATMKR